MSLEALHLVISRRQVFSTLHPKPPPVNKFPCTREANVLNHAHFALELDLIFEEILYFFDAKILRHFGKIRKHRNA